MNGIRFILMFQIHEEIQFLWNIYNSNEIFSKKLEGNYFWNKISISDEEQMHSFTS